MKIYFIAFWYALAWGMIDSDDEHTLGIRLMFTLGAAVIYNFIRIVIMYDPNKK